MNKPHLRMASSPIEAPANETRIQRARRIYGRPFGTRGKNTKGISFWTAERVAELAQANEALRRARI